MTGLGSHLTMAAGLDFRVSPRVIALAVLVALPVGELATIVEHELASNPALERIEPSACPACGANAHGGTPWG
jgi:hypothetical protein